ncbi:MAG: zf-TFIIB domain-containing protein [Sandaracinaceae bacterium]|nr:zf-TFIIB domain-containing protein [Sandaracinaceae bacterium]
MYRERTRACPVCAEPMSAIPLVDPAAEGAVEIDRCDRCGGTFFEFFDGEPIRLAYQTEETAPPTAGAAGSRPPVCPDCGTAMTLRRYLDVGPPVARCDACMALFLSPADLADLAATRLAPAPPAGPASWMERLMRWVRRVADDAPE